jgi:hypothetical protein
MWLANALATTLMVVACNTAAAQTLVGTPSDATGIDGLAFDGKTYDVTFEPGTFQGVFPAGLMFNGYGIGNDAAQDLAGVLTQLSVTGIQQINCDNDCNVLVPFNTDAGGNSNSWEVQTGFDYPINLTWSVNDHPFGYPANTYLGPPSPFFWAAFKPVTGVPEPSTSGLMFLGLASAMLVRRRRASRYIGLPS